MKHAALILCGDARFSRFLSTELGYLGVSAAPANDPQALSEDNANGLAALIDSNGYSLLVIDGDTCSESVRAWLAHNAPCPLLIFARDGANRLPPTDTGHASLFLQRPFAITDFDGAVRALLSLDPEGGHPLPLTPTTSNGIHGKHGTVTVTQADGIAKVQGHSVPLTATESAILACLLTHRGELVTRDTLAPLTGGGNSVDVYVCRLRRKLEKPLGIRLIHTVRGRGYRLG